MKVEIRILGRVVAEIVLDLDDPVDGEDITVLDREVKKLSTWWTRRMVK
jgi:hypothetical protein